MSRNKYPEQTVERILDAARRLFLEKGYEATTIQDIVDELGGLTKGAVYHHFKSKADIMNALGDRLFLERDPFLAVAGRKDLNGLEKLREVIRLHEADAEQQQLGREALPMLKNPRVLAEMLETNRRELTPRFLRLIEEGQRDGCHKHRLRPGAGRAHTPAHEPLAGPDGLPRNSGGHAPQVPPHRRGTRRPGPAAGGRGGHAPGRGLRRKALKNRGRPRAALF